MVKVLVSKADYQEVKSLVSKFYELLETDESMMMFVSIIEELEAIMKTVRYDEISESYLVEPKYMNAIDEALDIANGNV